MTFQSHQTLQSSGSFENYPALAQSAVHLLPTAGPIFGVVIIIGLSVYRLKVMDKQNKAEDKGKISADDKSKYSPQNSKDLKETTASSDATVSSSNTTISPSNNTSVSSTDTGGDNPETDYHKFLERYIDDLYNAGTEGDNILRSSGLGELVDNNWEPTFQQAIQIFAEFMNNF